MEVVVAAVDVDVFEPDEVDVFEPDEVDVFKPDEVEVEVAVFDTDDDEPLAEVLRVEVPSM